MGVGARQRGAKVGLGLGAAAACRTHVASFMLLKGMMPAMVAGSPKYSALTPSLLPMLARHATMLP